MKVFLIAALSADGFIAKNPHDATVWISKEDKQFFVEMTKKAGVVVMGLNTFKTLKKPLAGRHNVVYAKQTEGLGGAERLEEVEVTQKAPKALIASLAKRGYKEVAICGGQTMYTMFMEAGVVDKLYLTIEPVIFGQGLTLFNKEFDTKLELVDTRKLGVRTLLLEYNVVV